LCARLVDWAWAGGYTVADKSVLGEAAEFSEVPPAPELWKNTIVI